VRIAVAIDRIAYDLQHKCSTRPSIYNWKIMSNFLLTL